jgi:hypothetical protein
VVDSLSPLGKHVEMKRILMSYVCAVLLAACSNVPEPPKGPVAMAPPDWLPAATSYEVVDGDSLLAIRAYRAGSLARLGHNHVISTESLAGQVYVGSSYEKTWLELQFPVSRLLVDTIDMRARYGEDFASAVPEDAVAGTTENMLGADVLNSVFWPLVVVRGAAIACDLPQCQLRLEIELKGQLSQHVVPVVVEQHDDRLLVHSEFRLSQAALGIKPFSVMMGALSVADELQFELDLVATEVSASEAPMQ